MWDQCGKDNVSYDRGNMNINKIAQLGTQYFVILAKHVRESVWGDEEDTYKKIEIRNAYKLAIKWFSLTTKEIQVNNSVR